MSSLIRRIQKRIAKAQGWHRNAITGKIVDSDGENPRRNWPQVSAPTKEK